MDLLNKDPVIYIAMMYFSGVVRHSLHILVIFEINIQACTTSSVFIWLNKSGVFRGMGVGFWGFGFLVCFYLVSTPCITSALAFI